MEKIPTVEEFFFDYSVDSEYDNLSVNCKQEIAYRALEFARLHVEAALKAASEKADVVYDGISFGTPDYIVDVETILNSYPLKNIK